MRARRGRAPATPARKPITAHPRTQNGCATLRHDFAKLEEPVQVHHVQFLLHIKLGVRDGSLEIAFYIGVSAPTAGELGANSANSQCALVAHTQDDLVFSAEGSGGALSL